DAESYVLRIEGNLYTIHLQKHAFLSNDFQIYISNEQGSLPSDPAHLQKGCHYRGYIDGFPSSAVTLSTCSGLRGLLQFENISYGIEPLGSSSEFQHLVYQVSQDKTADSLLAHSSTGRGLGGLAAGEMLDEAPKDDEPLSAAAQFPKYLSVYVVLDKALYNYMGSDPNAAMQKIIQAFNLVNNMFNLLNVTIVLSSLELWAEGDKISTAGDADDLLQRFLQWKQSSLVLQEHNIAFLLGYRDQGVFVGTTALGKACQRDAAAAVVLYPGNVTLEPFSVLLAQVVSRSLGVSSDSSRACGCAGRVCIMSPEALHFSGAKAFSNCSAGDFATFLRQGRGTCLFHRPRLASLSQQSAAVCGSQQSAAVCGNGVLEPGEQCDCGEDQRCLKNKCCTETCQLKPGAKCSSGLCCKKCQFRRKNSPCRPVADAQCDLPEYCSGSSASCPSDLYVQDGHSCERGTGYCYHGRCQSRQRLFGRGSKNAPVACYEEINSQRDRFGNCGFQPRHGYQPCAWRDLRCGKLICTYPSSKPFPSATAAVIYAKVREHLCVSLAYLTVPACPDPCLVPPGTKCGPGKVCINNTCQARSVLGYTCDSNVKCHGHGVCNNKGQCHCHAGWQPPDCRQKRSRWWRSAGGLTLQRARESEEVFWLLLGFGLILLILAVAVVLILQQHQVLGCFYGRQSPGTEGASWDTDMEPEMEPDQELKQEPDLKPEPQIESKLGLELQMESELEQDPDPELQMESELELDLELKTDMDPA
ncbi:PREDICTED: disintegrin and metalloproteinase domain-containing protein 32-like, partial [Acanthisitta chloris]|uniref:disintegrin and metalloproteinase domain-containing protein 32-like n=1 Tax=Acanthisitta chloris TaxID=57068 RepID=UPI0004F0C50A